MANTPFTRSVYHDPSPGLTRSRRSSSTRSFASPLSRSTSNQDSLRPLCTKDEAFSFDTGHLKAWTLDDEKVWSRLPAQLRSELVVMRRAGAAVHSSFERLGLGEQLQLVKSDHLDAKVAGDEQLDQFNLPSPKFSTIGSAGTVFKFELPSPASTGSSASGSGQGTPVEPPNFVSQHMTPFSPISLGPSAEGSFSSQGSFNDPSSSTPLEPNSAYYKSELSTLRTEALPRLCHSVHRVNIDWNEAKAAGVMSPDEVDIFEKWWADRKAAIAHLSEEGKRLASECGLTPNGMGWTAP